MRELFTTELNILLLNTGYAFFMTQAYLQIMVSQTRQSVAEGEHIFIRYVPGNGKIHTGSTEQLLLLSIKVSNSDCHKMLIFQAK
jgi:hypothetical protein